MRVNEGKRPVYNKFRVGVHLCVQKCVQGRTGRRILTYRPSHAKTSKSQEVADALPSVPVEQASGVSFRNQHPFPRPQKLDQTYRLGISENSGVLRLRSIAFYHPKRGISEAGTDGPTRNWRSRLVHRRGTNCNIRRPPLKLGLFGLLLARLQCSAVQSWFRVQLPDLPY